MIVISFISITILLLIGKLLRANVVLCQKLYLPSSVIAGVLGLIAVQLLSRFRADGFVESLLPVGQDCPDF